MAAEERHFVRALVVGAQFTESAGTTVAVASSDRHEAIQQGFVVPALALTLVGTGCGGDENSTGAVAASDRQEEDAIETCGEGATDAEYALNAIRARAEMADGSFWGGDGLSDNLPNALYKVDGEARPIFDHVVVGEIVEASNGVGFSMPTSPEQEAGPNDGQTRVEFGDTKAGWETVHAEIAVEIDLNNASEADATTVVAGFVIDPCLDEARFRDGLLSLGRAVFFLSSDNAVFDYDEGVLGVGGNGALVATIDDTGALELPMLSKFHEERLLASSPTIDALMGAASAENHIVDGT